MCIKRPKSPPCAASGLRGHRPVLGSATGLGAPRPLHDMEPPRPTLLPAHIMSPTTLSSSLPLSSATSSLSRCHLPHRYSTAPVSCMPTLHHRCLCYATDSAAPPSHQSTAPASATSTLSLVHSTNSTASSLHWHRITTPLPPRG